LDYYLKDMIRNSQTRGRGTNVRGKAPSNQVNNRAVPVNAFASMNLPPGGRSMMGALTALNDLIEDYRSINGPSKSDTPAQVMNKLLPAVTSNNLNVIHEYCNFHKGIIASIINVPGRNSLLHLAAKQGRADIVKKFLECGANPNIVNEKGKTPLHKAWKSPETVKILIDFKACIEVKDHQGWTPLHTAVIKKEIETAKFLLKAGADLTVKDFFDKTPIDYCENLKVAKELEVYFCWNRSKSLVFLYHHSKYSQLPAHVFKELLGFV
jgi:hypothetical protein